MSADETRPCDQEPDLYFVCIWCGAHVPCELDDDRDYCSDVCAVAADTNARDPREQKEDRDV